MGPSAYAQRCPQRIPPAVPAQYVPCTERSPAVSRTESLLLFHFIFFHFYSSGGAQARWAERNSESWSGEGSENGGSGRAAEFELIYSI